MLCFVLVFRPLFDIGEIVICSVVRSVERGYVHPAGFVYVLEDNRLVQPARGPAYELACFQSRHE